MRDITFNGNLRLEHASLSMLTPLLARLSKGAKVSHCSTVKTGFGAGFGARDGRAALRCGCCCDARALDITFGPILPPQLRASL